MAIVSSPENLQKLDRYKDISRRLALAEGLTDDQARALAARGQGRRLDRWRTARQRSARRAATDRDGLSARQPFRRGDAALPARRDRPGGARQSRRSRARRQLVHARARSAARARSPAFRARTRSTSGTTTIATSTCRRQAETINMNRVLYKEWFPQIVYDHHQTGPAGTVMFAPPFRDPFNYVFDPLIPVGIDLVGAAMHARFAAEGKPGVTMRTRIELLDVVERRPADDGVLPQPDWAAHGNHRRPDADRNPVRARPAAAERRSAVSRSRRSAGSSASRSTTRSRRIAR